MSEVEQGKTSHSVIKHGIHVETWGDKSNILKWKSYYWVLVCVLHVKLWILTYRVHPA